MRVLTVGNMYPPHHLGGYELMWRSSVRQLRDAGHDVRVLTTDYRHPAPDTAIPEDPDAHRELRWYWRDHAWPRLSIRARWRLERHNLRVLGDHLAEFRPDAVAWWAMGGMSLSLIERALARGVSGVGVVVDDWLLYGPREDQWQRLIRRAGPLRRASGPLLGIPGRLTFDRRLEWVVVSEVILGHARSHGWALPRRVVAPAGVDHALFRAAPASAWAERLLCVGRIDRRKGLAVALEALALRPSATLRVVGAGDERHLTELRAQAEALGIAARVNFETASRAKLPAIYAAADAVLFPVLWEEPFGIVPLEAMATGRPVVASGRGGSGEYLRDRENCLLYGPAEDPQALAAAIATLADQPALRRELVTGGTETARNLGEDAFNRQVETAVNRAVGR